LPFRIDPLPAGAALTAATCRAVCWLVCLLEVGAAWAHMSGELVGAELAAGFA
jgi:hypothetical protein